MPDAGVNPDANAPQARLQVCTPEGCSDPLRMNFGGSRIGVTSQQTLTIRNNGDLPLELLNIDVLRQGTEFSADPSGDLDTTLAPNEELAVRVSHTAIDGTADNETLQILSNADRSRVLVQLVTEYKGVPSLYVGTEPAPSAPDVTILDFGNVRAGTNDTRTLFLKNKDRVRDGSILAISEIRTDPTTSSNFSLTVDGTAPVLLNQFEALCAMDSSCDTAAGDTCDVNAGVCRTATGTIRDALSATITFRGTTPGLVEEALVIASNDGGQPGAVRRVILRANVTAGDLEVSPDPIEFTEAFLGFRTTRTVTLTNPGNAPVVVSAISLAPQGDFGLELGGLVLPATLAANGGSATIEVTLTAQTPGTLSSSLVISTDDVIEPMKIVAITANAMIAPELVLTHSRIDFGDTHTCTTQQGGTPSCGANPLATVVGRPDPAERPGDVQRPILSAVPDVPVGAGRRGARRVERSARAAEHAHRRQRHGREPDGPARAVGADQLQHRRDEPGAPERLRGPAGDDDGERLQHGRGPDARARAVDHERHARILRDQRRTLGALLDPAGRQHGVQRRLRAGLTGRRRRDAVRADERPRPPGQHGLGAAARHRDGLPRAREYSGHRERGRCLHL
ncbi:choice-of-anchor D domain-containing protein [Myxococcota bacterium]|nr:choice-of-anchor D domain-containing protein [Myxococcota bacterium]